MKVMMKPSSVKLAQGQVLNFIFVNRFMELLLLLSGLIPFQLTYTFYAVFLSTTLNISEIEILSFFEDATLCQSHICLIFYLSYM